MSPPPVLLPSRTLSLRIAPVGTTENPWCQVHLIGPGLDLSLGAYTSRYLREHLLGFLDFEAPEERWVFSLAERHCSGYGSRRDDGLHLRIQDANAILFATLVLGSSERESWRQNLEQLPG